LCRPSSDAACHPQLIRRLLSILVLLAALAALAISHATEASPATAVHGLAVTGFILEGDSTTEIDHSAAALTTVGVDGAELQASGAAIRPVGAPAQRELSRAHADKLRGELLISNYSETIHDFSEPIAHLLLSSPTHIATVASALADAVRAQHWQGICVDLEALTPRDASGLVAFLRAAHHDLPSGSSLSIAVSNATTPGGFAARGYELAAIGKAATRVILMAYDEHGPWENTPGPIGALSWQRTGLAVLTHAVRASKVDLGVAGYGYGWRPHSNVHLSDAGARALAASKGVSPVWGQAAGEWTARLPDGSVLWWSDARSYAVRAALAKSLGLHGLAVWSLGLSDPLTAAG
jgi:spore germination protein